MQQLPLPTLYGAEWCPDCRRAKDYLNTNGIAYTYVDVDLDISAAVLTIGNFDQFYFAGSVQKAMQ